MAAEGGQPGEWISQVYEKCRGEVLLESQIQFHESGESRVTEISQEKTRLELETEALEQRLEWSNVTRKGDTKNDLAKLYIDHMKTTVALRRFAL